MSPKESFSSRLRKCIDQKNLQQKELAIKIGVTPARLSSYVCGRVEPSFDVFVSICREFNVSADYLLGLTDIPTAKSVSHDLLRVSVKRDPFANLTPEQRAAAEQLVQTFLQINSAASKDKEA